MPTQSEYWWEAKTDIHRKVSESLSAIEQNQKFRSTENLRHLRLYGNYDVNDLSLKGYSRPQNPNNRLNRVTLNIIQSIIDTVTSKIAKNKPRPMFLTDGGNWSEQRKAKKLTKFCEGQFYATEMYRKGQKIFRDACIFGTGVIKIYKKAGHIYTERVFIDEIYVDDVESIYGEPRAIHQTKWVHKETLKRQYPKFESEIEHIGREHEHLNTVYKPTTGMVRVTESWHLPSTKDATDGKHAITIETATLHEEEYNKQYFPFAFLRWTERPLGFYGQGLAEQLQGIQIEINKILRNIQVAMHLTSVPKVFVEQGSKVVKSHINNEIGGIVTYSGTKPSYESVGAVPPELFSHLDRLYARAFEIAGVSQLSAQSKKPGGLDSGRALRIFNDIESERFMTVGQAYERFYMDVAKIMIDLAREIAEEQEGGFKVKVKGKKFFETINWKEVDLEEDQYIMQIFPTSALSNTPAGRLQEVQELLQAGFISQEDGIKLLDFPDLEATTNLTTAAIEEIGWLIEQIVEREQYHPPEPFEHLELAINKFQLAYLKNKAEGAPEEVLELLRRWIEDAQAIIAPPEQPQVQPPMPGEVPQQMTPDGQAIAQGAPPPVSEILPFE